jgi:hypothetical protein
LSSLIDGGFNTGGETYVVGLCVDKNSIPHYQSIHYLTDIPATQQNIGAYATIMANTRRSLGNSITYTIGGAFFTNTGIMFQPNKFISIVDVIHNYRGDMLIHDVVFDYDVESGLSQTTIKVVPYGSFTSLSPEDLVKIALKNKTK